MGLYRFYSIYDEKSLSAVLNYENLLNKLQRNKINLYFNKTCKRLKLTPNYIKVNIRDKSIAAQSAKQKCEQIWLTKSIKQLYTKINILTMKTYNAQLVLSKMFHRLEYKNIVDQVETNTVTTLRKKRLCIKNKIRKLKAMKRTSIQPQEAASTSHVFFERIHNLTNINLDESEIGLLRKGLKHAIEPKTNNKKESQRHLISIENAILNTSSDHQEEIRTLILNKLSNKIPVHSKYNKNEQKIINTLKQKFKENDVIVTKADKGNTTVLMYTSVYNNKIDEYIMQNDINSLTSDPTKSYLKDINKDISNSAHLLSKYQMNYCKMIKPAAPQINGLPKIHKPDVPMRPLINFTTAPTYKIAKVLNKWITNHIKIPNDKAIINNMELVDKIKSVVIPNGAKLASFDITNMYSNIPIDETLKLTRDLLILNNVDSKQIDEAIILLKRITKQNYFKHNKKCFAQTEGLPMGSPLSGTLSNIFLNHFETSYVINQRNKFNNNIVYWHRYVDDILILFKGSHRQLDNLHKYINNIHPKIKFTLEVENNKSINFLDITIENIDNAHHFKIYRKPTQTDHTIHNTSNHPMQHKLSAYNHMLRRLNNIPMSNSYYEAELKTIMYIATQNGYTSKLISQLNNRIKNKIYLHNLTTLYNGDYMNTKRYITIDYNKNTSCSIKRILHIYGYSTAYYTNHKIVHKLNSRPPDDNQCGIYQLNCNDCSKFYIGQTGRSFKQRFEEHVKELHNMNTNIKSNFAQHLQIENHTYTDINENMKVLYNLNKGKIMDRLEELEIYRNRNNPLLLNEKVYYKANRVYDMIINNTCIL